MTTRVMTLTIGLVTFYSHKTLQDNYNLCCCSVPRTFEQQQQKQQRSETHQTHIAFALLWQLCLALVRLSRA